MSIVKFCHIDFKITNMMFALFFHVGIFLVFAIQATSSDELLVKTEVGSTDKVGFLNLPCQVTSERKICQSFGARDVVHDGNCSCSCPQNASTFGFDDKICKCLSKNITYGGCPKFSQITANVLQRNSSTKLFLTEKNCSLAVLNRQNNGSWITAKNVAGTVKLTSAGELNGSFVYVLQVSNSVEDFQGRLYNVIVQCPKQNSTCFLLKLPSKIECLFTTLTSTRATTKPNSTTPTPNINSSGLSKGEIAAIVVSCIVFFAIILLLLLFLWFRRRRQYDKDKRRPSRQQMTLEQDEERRSSKPSPVVFSRPDRASTQPKDSANLGYEPDGGTTCNDNDEEPDYDVAIDEKHSIISDFFNKIKRPLSIKKSPPNTVNEKEEKADNDDDYQIMENLGNPENTVVYENTRNGSEPKQEEMKQPTSKKSWRNKMKRKDKKSDNKGRSKNEGKSQNSYVPQLTVTNEVPKKKNGDSIEHENFYENDEVIRDNIQHQEPSGTLIHEHRASYSNDVPQENDEEEGPQPPPRTTSLERILDQPADHRPIRPSPRIRNRLPNAQTNDDFNYENDNTTEDPSELYENTRKSSYPTPTPRVKR